MYRSHWDSTSPPPSLYIWVSNYLLHLDIHNFWFKLTNILLEINLIIHTYIPFIIIAFYHITPWTNLHQHASHPHSDILRHLSSQSPWMVEIFSVGEVWIFCGMTPIVLWVIEAVCHHRFMSHFFGVLVSTYLGFTLIVSLLSTGFREIWIYDQVGHWMTNKYLEWRVANYFFSCNTGSKEK